MKNIPSFTAALMLALCAGAGRGWAASPAGAVRDLYSEKPEVRAAAFRDLSSVNSGPEIEKIMAAFKSELACAQKKPRPSRCHDPEFVRGVLLVAGELAKKDPSSPWYFLVGLASGNSSADGSFFQDRSSVEEGDFREDGYYSPGRGAGASRAQLQKLLDEVMKNAGVRPACDWSLEKVRARAKKTQELDGYQVYSYAKNYSPKGLQEQYRVVYSQNWIFRGADLAYCGEASRLASFGKAGVLAIKADDAGGEEPAYNVELYDLAGKKTLCSYSARGDLTEGAELFDLEQLGPEKLVSSLLFLDKGACSPRKLKGYTFTKN